MCRGLIEAKAAYFTPQLREAGDPSAFPAASIARTWKVWLPMASPEYVVGLVHGVNTPVSSLHSNVEFASDEVKVKVAVLGLLLPEGPPVIVVLGADVSTVQLHEAGDASTFPVASVARTWKAWAPWPRPE